MSNSTVDCMSDCREVRPHRVRAIVKNLRLLVGGSLFVAACLAAFFAPPPLAAPASPAPGDVDLTFVSGDFLNPAIGANGSVNAVVALSGGKVLIGGEFTAYSGTAVGRVARLNNDGSLDATFTTTTGADGPVNTVVALANGQVLIGGSFTKYDNTPVIGLARLNGDGSLDLTFNSSPATGLSTHATVNAAAELADGKLLIGGDFTTYNGTATNGVARLNNNGSLDTTFITTTGTDMGVRSVAALANGDVLIGGYFTTYNGTAANGVARLNDDGSLDTAFNTTTGISEFDAVYSVAALTNDKVLIGGNFTTYNGTAAPYVARLNSDGSLDTTFNPSPAAGPNAHVNSAVALPNGQILIGGNFTFYNGTNAGNAARLNSDGSLDTAFNTTIGANFVVFSVATSPEGMALIGGSFSEYNGTYRNRVVRVLSQTRLEVTIDGSGAGSVTSVPSAMNCSTGTCEAWFDPSTTVTLTSSTGANSTFMGWSGACYGAGSSCTVTMTEAKSTTVTFAALPDPPTALNATPGNQSATISFTPGADNGEPLTNYQYSYSSDEFSWNAFSPPQTSSPVTISGLNNGTTYQVKLRAMNSAGASQESTPVSVTPHTIPAAPTTLVASAGDQSASITFNPGADNGSAITNYDYSTDNGASWITRSPDSTTSPITITSLNNGTIYQIKLRARNTAGPGTASSAVTVTPHTIPAAPTTLVASAGDQSASITFNPGADNGSAITNYEYSLDNGAWVAITPTTTTSPVTISGLTNGTPYSIRLRARNSAGPSTASASVSATPVTATSPVATPEPTPDPTPDATPATAPSFPPGSASVVILASLPIPPKPSVRWGSVKKTRSITALITPSSSVSYTAMATRGTTVKQGRCKPVSIKQGKKKVARVSCQIRVAKGTWRVSITPKMGSATGTANSKSFTFR